MSSCSSDYEISKGDVFACQTEGCDAIMVYLVKGEICADCEGKFCEYCVNNGSMEDEDEWLCDFCYRSYFP